MAKEKLKNDLERLKFEMDESQVSDPQVRALLEQHIVDIERQVTYPAEAEHPETLAARLGESMLEFESQHPRAAAIVNEIMMTLNNMGV